MINIESIWINQILFVLISYITLGDFWHTRKNYTNGIDKNGGGLYNKDNRTTNFLIMEVKYNAEFI